MSWSATRTAVSCIEPNAIVWCHKHKNHGFEEGPMIASYPVRIFELKGLRGLSTLQIETHLELYAGYEYNGMRLHELYFENLTPHYEPPKPESALYRELDRTFGRFERWQRDFTAVASMRGVGWAILYLDPETGRLSNHWISLHEHGHPAGFQPLLVMDVWEHAFLVDYRPTERAKYIE